MADDRLDEVGCGAVAAHVSRPHLQPPPATAEGKKRREPMKKGSGNVMEMGVQEGVTRPGDNAASCKEVARFGRRVQASPLSLLRARAS